MGWVIVALNLVALPPKTVHAAAGINKQINFQGKVVNGNGTNVANGTYTFTFAVYGVSSGGSAIWTENQSLTVTDGVFQVNLGAVTSLPGSVDFNSDTIYLGMNFNGDGEMTPRIRFTSVPQAFNSDKLGGVAASLYARQDAANTFTADQLVKTTSATAFKIQNSGATTTLLTADTTGVGSLTVGVALNANSTLVVGGQLSASGGIVTTNTSINAGTGIITGNGSGLTTLNASNLSSGTVSDVRLSSNVALLDRADQTFTSRNVFTGAGNGTTTGGLLYQNATNSLTAFQIQNSLGTSNLLIADTVNNRIGINKAPGSFALDVNGAISSSSNIIASTSVQVSATSASAGTVTKGFGVGTTGVATNDVVVIANESGVAKAVTTTTARDSRVFGVSTGTSASGSGNNFVLAGNTLVNADTSAVAIGDQLVTSTTAGAVTANNSATTGVVGFATTAKAAGSAGTVGVHVQVQNGQNSPIFRNATDSATAFQIQNAGSTALLSVDTTGSGTVTTGSGVSLVVTTLAAATGAVSVCRNTSNQLSSCGSNPDGVSLQQAYSASTLPAAPSPCATPVLPLAPTFWKFKITPVQQLT